MFTKKKPIGTAQRVQKVTAYKKVTDWDAVGKAFFWGFIALVVIGAIAGGK